MTPENKYQELHEDLSHSGSRQPSPTRMHDLGNVPTVHHIPAPADTSEAWAEKRKVCWSL